MILSLRSEFPVSAFGTDVYAETQLLALRFIEDEKAYVNSPHTEFAQV